jgi:hypothetical protein
MWVIAAVALQFIQDLQEDPQDPVKLSLGLCYICDRDKWNSIRSSISRDDLIKHIQHASSQWKTLYEEELKLRS